ncbi:hypothetical protein BDZ85DRAFT_246247 [Elsinoe ampelina]|uniref:Uncharacterized protein n=1 Tax=Elsinoe ampelina TaxID=302913 RepID=A0A6A6GPT6_9PEZI|nr:hypothetical protein BDZ85DRAFT_246247 [Elsinoe ampelina]
MHEDAAFDAFDHALGLCSPFAGPWSWRTASEVDGASRSSRSSRSWPHGPSRRQMDLRDYASAVDPDVLGIPSESSHDLTPLKDASIVQEQAAQAYDLVSDTASVFDDCQVAFPRIPWLTSPLSRPFGNVIVESRSPSNLSGTCGALVPQPSPKQMVLPTASPAAWHAQSCHPTKARSVCVT